MKKYFLITTLILFSLNSFASPTNQSVEKFVDKIGKEIVSIANQNELSDKKKEDKIIAVIDGAIDSDWIARFVLAKNYKTSSDQQKAKFTKLYREFMIKTYGPKFKKYNGRKFEVKEVNEQSSFYIAKAEFTPRDSNVPISVNFRVKERGNKLVILDFIAEGVSLIETQRSEFNSAISQNGMDQFLKDFEARVKNLGKK